MQKTYIWRQRKQCTTSARNFDARSLRWYCPYYTLLHKFYWVWLFSCKLTQCFPHTSKCIRSRGSTSSTEQNYIVTIYDSCKDWILVYKIANQIHTIFKVRKSPQYSFAQKMAAVTRSMQYLLKILWETSWKIPVWSEAEEAVTLLKTFQNYSELFLSSKFLQNYF